MDEDGEEPLPWFEEDMDFPNQLIPGSSQWYEPDAKEFPVHEDLSIAYSWSNYCTRALDDLRRHPHDVEVASCYDNEYGRLTYTNSFRPIKIIVDVTIVQQELLARQDAFKEITEQLAARRFEVSGGHDAHSTFRVCNRCYPCALDGLLDVHKRVGVHVYPAGTPILSAMASVLPHVRSSTPLHAPYYAGHAAAKRFPNDGLDSQSIITLANSPEFQEAVTQAYRKNVMSQVFDQIQDFDIRDFDGQVVLAGIKAELSILSQARKAKPTALISTNDSDAQTGPTSSKPKGELKLSPCYLKALGGYKRAVDVLGDCEDREAYDWLKEHDEDRSLPNFATWARYLREARKRLGLPKNTPRYGRTGRSIVRPDEL
jgi:hypothetical protein